MQARLPILRLLLAGGALLSASCARQGPPLSANPTIATRQANKLLPKGTLEARATTVLQARGFHVSRLNSDTAVNHLLVGTCTHENHTWLVGVVIVNGRVAACSVTINELSSVDAGGATTGRICARGCRAIRYLNCTAFSAHESYCHSDRLGTRHRSACFVGPEERRFFNQSEFYKG